MAIPPALSTDGILALCETTITASPVEVYVASHNLIHAISALRDPAHYDLTPSNAEQLFSSAYTAIGRLAVGSVNVLPDCLRLVERATAINDWLRCLPKGENHDPKAVANYLATAGFSCLLDDANWLRAVTRSLAIHDTPQSRGEWQQVEPGRAFPVFRLCDAIADADAHFHADRHKDEPRRLFSPTALEMHPAYKSLALWCDGVLGEPVSPSALRKLQARVSEANKITSREAGRIELTDAVATAVGCRSFELAKLALAATPTDGPGEGFTVFISGIPINLAACPTSFRLLESLWDADRQKWAASRDIEDVVRHVWGSSSDVRESRLKTACHRTNKAIEKAGAAGKVTSRAGKIWMKIGHVTAM